MPLDVRARLLHVDLAITRISEVIAETSFEQYASDWKVRSATERQFTIIGEALREAWKIDPLLHEKITDLREILDFRNVLVHGYTSIYDEGVWAIIHDHLPRLHAEVRALLP